MFIIISLQNALTGLFWQLVFTWYLPYEYNILKHTRILPVNFWQELFPNNAKSIIEYNATPVI